MVGAGFWQRLPSVYPIPQQQQPFNGRLSGTTRVGRYQKKHSPAHTHPGQCTSFITFLQMKKVKKIMWGRPRGQAQYHCCMPSWKIFWVLWSRGRKWRQRHRQSRWAPPPTELTATPPPITSPSFYRPDALSDAQLDGSRLLIYIYRSWPPYLAVVPLSTTWGRGW